MQDIDFTALNARPAALHQLNVEFVKDPLMCLFDRDHRLRLASYIVDRLAKDAPKTMYHATRLAEEAVYESPYGVFGPVVKGHIGYLVQKSLYTKSFVAEGGKL